ncbi:hypothetical protein [Leifsonia sp. Leaf264]|uniref:hypothetical protein n=1 Tax=Leifsonia sp. Leaf264 TaxID=1736314 RepID=UPI0006F9211C|nr:hypothetical protein [Leifsonia sp. Leaf264]KQO98381.1 hypothetical protein ASF30_09990 [Leifsonia sp. Leaf264]
MFGIKKKTAKPAGPVFAFCERVTATPTSPNHIRQLTEVGMKQGGGADTLALCGAEVAWDTLIVDFDRLPHMLANQHETARYCPTCSEAALQQHALATA